MSMKHPKTTITLAILVAAALWVWWSGREPAREPAPLAALETTAHDGRVLVLGGTRGVGLEVVRILRERGDRVTALVREGSDASAPEALGADIARGDALRIEDIAAALAEGEYRAVVSTLGSRGNVPVPPDYEGNRNAIDAAKAAGINRVVMVTVIGAGNSEGRGPWIARKLLAKIIDFKTRAESHLQDSGLEWTIIRPGGLFDAPASGTAFATADVDAYSWIGRTDVALLTVRALDDPAAVGRIYHAFDPDYTRFWTVFGPLMR